MNRTTEFTGNVMTQTWRTVRFVILLLWTILTRPQEALQFPRFSEYFHSKNIFRHYVLPLSAIASIANIVGLIVPMGDTSLQSAVINSIFTFITYILSFYLLYIIVLWFTRKWYNHTIHRWNIEALVAAILSVSFAIKILLGLFPSMFFLQFFFIYTFYIVWVATDSLVPVPEQQKNRYLIIVSFISFVTPWAVNKIMHFMVPNISY